MKKIIKKIIPETWLLWYHKFLAILANLVYHSPSLKMTVIGVTGTNGKTTVCHLMRDLLDAAGFRVGMTTSIDFQDGKSIWENNTKQGMPGRFRLQKLLNAMVKNNCTHAIIETTSEGIKQFRHYKVDYNLAVLTNLTRDHIESHGSFEAYREAKGKLFEIVSKKNNGIAIVNLDDPSCDYFLKFKAKTIYGYGFEKKIKKNVDQYIVAYDLRLYAEGSTFKVNNEIYSLAVPGRHNVANSMAAIATGLALEISPIQIKKALANYAGIPGRIEEVGNKKGFRIFVDYAHTEDALEKVYETLKAIPHRKIIAVLGATGGGRDKRKRPFLGNLAGRYCDQVYVTNEDPYEEDPQEIIDQVFAGVKDAGKEEGKNCWRILDRAQAIKSAIYSAFPSDIIIITGKGCEKVMATKEGMIPWDDREVVKKVLKGDL